MNRVVVRDLTVSLDGREVLSQVDLSIGSGEFVAIVGPNGSGKSTLLRAMAGSITPGRGTVEIDGAPISRMNPRSAAAARSYLPQEHVTDIGFNVSTVVGFGAFISEGIDESHDRVQRAMTRVGVSEVAHRPFQALSGGEQRRVTIARVLCQAAPVVLLDEPTDSLDLGHADLVMAAAAEEASSGRIVITSSHDLNVAAKYATSMVLLHKGRIIRAGSPADVLDADLLSEIYAIGVTVIPHPETGLPIVIR